jgi:4-amino-4-deoxy-L-arabinose transferase-like glycosyltransferase
MESKKALWMMYLSLVILKVVFAFFVSSPTIFGDEYLYAKAAQSIAQEGSVEVHGMYVASYPPLYSLVLSPAYLFTNMQTIYLVMKIINALISSLIIIPAYLLAKEFFKEKEALMGALLVGLMPFTMSTSSYLMAENLFHVLFLLSVYFIFKSITTEGYKYSIFAGISIAATTLTKFSGLILLAITGLMALWFIIKNHIPHLKQTITAGIIASIILASWLLISTGAQITNIMGIIGRTVATTAPSLSISEMIVTFLAWIAIYALYLVLGTGILPTLFIRSPENKKEKILFLLTIGIIGLLLLILAKRSLALSIKETTLFSHFTGRVIGRYIDSVLPLLLLLGWLGISHHSKSIKKNAWLVTIITLAGFLIWYFPLFPYNNASLTLFGVLKTLITRSITDISLPIIAALTALLIAAIWIIHGIRSKITSSTAYGFLLVFFILSSIASIGATVYNANTWSTTEQLTLSKELSRQISPDKTILIDEKYCGTPLTKEGVEYLCTANKQISYVGFWLMNNILVGNQHTPADYIITRDVLDKQIITKTPNGIQVYQI